MSGPLLRALLAVALVAGAAAQVAVDDRILVLTNPSGLENATANVDFIVASLQAVKANHEVKIINPSTSSTGRPNWQAMFYNADGTGRYRGIFMYPPLEAIGELTPDEIAFVNSYMVATGARMVKFGANMTTVGYQNRTSARRASNVLYYTADAPMGTSGISVSSLYSSGGLVMAPGNPSKPLGTCNLPYPPGNTVLTYTCTSKPFLLINVNSPYSIAGVLVNHTDGRRVMAYEFQCGGKLALCAAMGRLSTDWLINGPKPPNTTVVAPPPQQLDVTPPPPLTIEHRVLMLYGENDFTKNIDFMEAVAQGYGVPYDVVKWDKASTDLSALLWNDTDGSARYSAIVMRPNLEEWGLMSKAQLNTLWGYQNRTGARTVKVNSWMISLGMDYTNQASSDGVDQFEFVTGAPLGVSGVNPAAKFDLATITRNPSVPDPDNQCIIWTDQTVIQTCTVTPVIKKVGVTAPGGTIAAITTYPDHESLGLLFDCAAWNPSCILIGHMALSWAMRNFLPGERTALLSVHMDDVFATTDQNWAVGTGSTTARVKANDLTRHIRWQQQLANNQLTGVRVPAGSFIRLEMPINGNGVLEVADPNNALDVDDRNCDEFDDYKTLGCTCWNINAVPPPTPDAPPKTWADSACQASPSEFCRTCIKDWPKTPGSGANRIKQVANTASWTTALLNKDPLAKYIIANTNSVRSEFFWCDHTFTHQNLNNATTYDSQWQIGYNRAMALKLGLTTTNGLPGGPANPAWSTACMVTPQISGLSNGDTLAALAQQSTTCGMGDNTWPYLRGPNPHRMLLTSQAMSNFVGFSIIPRFATEIYFNCSTRANNTALYNSLQRIILNNPSLPAVDFATLLDREARRVSLNMLLLRADPHMMHQANLVVESSALTSFSLVTSWVETVLKRITSFVTWPIRSFSLDQLFNLYKARENRANCRLSYRLTVPQDGSGVVSAVTISRTSDTGDACDAPITVDPAAVVTGATRPPPIGADAPTVRVTLTNPGALSVQLPVSGVPWAPIKLTTTVPPP